MSACLYSFAVSHFCEKARFALDLAGLDYQEVHLAPGPHVPAAKRLGCRGSSATPILATGSVIIQGSGSILDHAGFSPSNDRFEDFMDEIWGPAVRRCFYLIAFNDPAFDLKAALTQGCSRRTRLFFMLMWPVTSRLMRKSFDIDPDKTAEAIADLMVLLDRIDREIDRNPALHASRINRSMLTTASLISPLLNSDKLPVYERDRQPAAWQQLIDQVSDRLSIQWGREIYARFRPASPTLAALP